MVKVLAAGEMFGAADGCCLSFFPSCFSYLLFSQSFLIRSVLLWLYISSVFCLLILVFLYCISALLKILSLLLFLFTFFVVFSSSSFRVSALFLFLVILSVHSRLSLYFISVLLMLLSLLFFLIYFFSLFLFVSYSFGFIFLLFLSTYSCLSLLHFCVA